MTAVLAHITPRALISNDERSASPAAVAHCDASALRFDVIRDLEGLASVEREWLDLFARAGRSAQVFQSFEWIWQWASHFVPAKSAVATSLALVIGRRQGRLVLVWPLVMEHRSGLAVLTWAGDPVSQYGDVVADDVSDIDDLLEQSWSYIVARLKPDLLHLRKVRSDAVVAPLLRLHDSQQLARTTAPYLDLSGARSFHDYEQRYAAKARKNRRRLMRRLEERGPVAFEMLEGSPVARERSRLAISLKRAWLKERGLVSPALLDERVVTFFEAASSGGGRSPGCRVSTLSSNGETAAIEVAFPCKGRLAVHIIVYSLKFEKAGAGVLLLEQSIARAIEEGITTIDLLAPGDAYKMDWADGAVDVADHAVPLSGRGKVYARVYLGFIRERAKSTIAQLPLSLRRMMATGAALLLSLS